MSQDKAPTEVRCGERDGEDAGRAPVDVCRALKLVSALASYVSCTSSPSHVHPHSDFLSHKTCLHPAHVTQGSPQNPQRNASVSRNSMIPLSRPVTTESAVLSNLLLKWTNLE